MDCKGPNPSVSPTASFLECWMLHKPDGQRDGAEVKRRLLA
jgi:hypothetical protein